MLGDSSVLVSLDAQAGSLHLTAGEVGEALACCLRGLGRLGAGSRERWQQSYLLALQGFCLLMRGEHAGSAEAFGSALEMKHEIGDTMGTGYALEGIAWLAVARRRYARAAALLGAAESLWQLAGGRLGGNPTVQGRHARAEQAARDALGESRYQALHDQGAGYPLAEIVRLAAEDADELPPHPGGPASGGDAGAGAAATGLTRRERQIAERLVISKRTVDAHIEHIYGKLGVSSRVQLASWLRSARR